MVSYDFDPYDIEFWETFLGERDYILKAIEWISEIKPMEIEW